MADYSPARAAARAASASPATATWSTASSSTSATRSWACRTCTARCCSPTPATSTTTSPPTSSCASATRAYEPLVRASASRRARSREIAATHGIARGRDRPHRPARPARRARGFGDLAAGVRFWADVWDAVHLEEIYVEIAAPSALRVAPSADIHLDELLDGLPEWTRVHRSTVAVESFAQTLLLLHHEGVLVAQDLFVREISQYAAFRGPGKLEGSIVNWLNGADLPARRRPRRLQREGRAVRATARSPTPSVLTARQRDAYQRPTPATAAELVRSALAMACADALASRPVRRHGGVRAAARSRPRARARGAPRCSPARSTRSTSPTTRRRRSSCRRWPPRRC